MMSRRAHPRRTVREIVQDVVLTVLSLVIVGGAAMAIFTPPEKSIALGVESEPIASDVAIVYGTVVDVEGKPVRGARVAVIYENGNGPEQIASVSTAADGSFRVVSSGPFGTYRVVVAADIGTTTARDSITFQATAGHAYGITAELVNRDYFIFLPVVGY